MKRLPALALVTAIAFWFGCAFGGQVTPLDPTAKASPEVMAKMATGEPQDFIVVFNDSTIQNEAEALRSEKGLAFNDQALLDLVAQRLSIQKSQILSTLLAEEISVRQEYSHLPSSFVRVKSRQALDKLLKHPGVVGVYENKRYQRQYLAQSLPLIGQPRAAASGALGAGTAVAVLDQRVDYTNSAFGPCSAPGLPVGCKVLVAQDAPNMPNDGLGFQHNHGTNVAATVLAVAPGSKVISLNVFIGEHAQANDILSAINWCVANKPAYNIVAMNLSLGSGGDTAPSTASPYYSGFAQARAAGILPVVAAGNTGYTNKISQPASVVGAVSVGAVYDSSYGSAGVWVDANCTDFTTFADQVTCFSNSSSFLTLLAPGCKDDAAGSATNWMCGTSQAAPHVAGAVAVLRAAFPSETLDQTVARLTNGTLVTDARNGVTKPRLNLATALNLPPCSYGVSSTAISIPAGGTSGNSLSVTTAAGCSWAASPSDNWITILSGNNGTGNGAIQYAVSPNNGPSPRTGTIGVGGVTATISQAAGSQTLSNPSNIWLIGAYGVQFAGTPVPTSASLTVSNILNSSVSRTSGTLRLELWLSTTPFTQQGGTGWRIATFPITIANGILGPGQYFYSFSGTSAVSNLPAPGAYYLGLLVTEYFGPSCNTPDHFCMDTLGNFNQLFYVPDVTPPSVPTGLTASAASSAQANLTWNASVDDLAVTAYKIYINGTLLGRVSASTATVTGLSPSTTYQFAVSACDAASNCSAQSAPVSATTPGSSPITVNGATVAQFASRAMVTPSSAVYGGFQLANPTNLYIAVRGPSLGTLGITPTPLARPLLTLYNQSGVALTSSNQCSGNTPDSAAVVSFYQNVRNQALDPNDACLGFVTSALPAGVYTFTVTSDASNPSGSGEVVFDTTPAGSGAILMQFGTRGTVTPSHAVYGGFVLANPTALIVAVRGPSLGTLGITPTPLARPRLTLYNQSGQPLATNSQCGAAGGDNALVTAFYQTTRGQPLDANDPCLGYVNTTLPAGYYTFSVASDPAVPGGSGEIVFDTTPLH